MFQPGQCTFFFHHLASSPQPLQGSADALHLGKFLLETTHLVQISDLVLQLLPRQKLYVDAREIGIKTPADCVWQEPVSPRRQLCVSSCGGKGGCAPKVLFY